MQRIAEELCGSPPKNETDKIDEKRTGTSKEKSKDLLNYQMPQQNNGIMLHL